MANPLDVVGRLLVDMDGTSAEVEARGDTIVVGLPSLRAGFSLLKRWPGGRGRRDFIGQVHRGLVAAGLRLEVQVGRRAVGLLGVGSRANLASRLLGVDPLQLLVGGLRDSRRRVDGPPER